MAPRGIPERPGTFSRQLSRNGARPLEPARGEEGDGGARDERGLHVERSAHLDLGGRGERVDWVAAPALSGDDVARIAALVRERSRERLAIAEPLELGADGAGAPRVAWIKGAPLARSGARRHGLAARLGFRTPRRAEYAHLAWLRARLFRAPEPWLAARVVRGIELAYEALVTEHQGDVTPLDRYVRAHPGELDALSEELARELGRMHALRFLHADLYPRNVLVSPPAHEGAREGRRLAFVDCWAGGPGRADARGARPLARDLGTWFVDGAELLGRAREERFFDVYFESRRASGRPVADRSRFLARCVAERRRELRRLEVERGRLRGAPFPRAGWEPAARLG